LSEEEQQQDRQGNDGTDWGKRQPVDRQKWGLWLDYKTVEPEYVLFIS
jgi:hypothetical protein